MAIINPAPWLQNSGAANTAALMRIAAAGALKYALPGTNRVAGKAGISLRPASFGNYGVTQNGGGDMSVNVQPGLAYVPGTQSSVQAGYWAFNDASVNLAVTAAHPTNNRTDSVYVAIQDDFYSGGTHVAVLALAAGDPNFPTTPPTLPANSFEIARVTVLAATTSILTAQIADRRVWLTALGGIQQAQSFEIADSGGPVAGEYRYNLGSETRLQEWDGAAWRPAIGMCIVSSVGNVINPRTGQWASHSTEQMLYRWNGASWKPGPNFPKFYAVQSVAQTIANNSWTPVTFSTEDVDTHNGHSTVSSTSRYTVPIAGEYLASGLVCIGGATNARLAGFARNGVMYRGSATRLQATADGQGTNLSPAAVLIPCAANDYIELMVLHAQGTSVSTLLPTVEQSSSFTVTYTGGQ
jgi:hypothetical protein